MAVTLGMVCACDTGSGVVPPGPTASAVQTARLTDYLDQQAQLRLFRGAVEIRLGDRVVLSRGYGEADVAKRIVNSPRSGNGGWEHHIPFNDPTMHSVAMQICITHGSSL